MSRVIVEVPSTTKTKTTNNDAPQVETANDTVSSSVSDLADRLKERLSIAQQGGAVADIDIKASGTRASSGTRSKTPTQQKPNPIEQMDLGLLSNMIWDTISNMRGWSDVGLSVDAGSKKQWAEALKPVLSNVLGELISKYHAEATLIICTLLIAAPREQVVWKKKREEKKKLAAINEDEPLAV